MAVAGARCALLRLAADDAQVLALARDGGHAFVSSALRPYAVAALVDVDERARARPTLVVVGDDRAARDLAADLRSWLAPRRVRCIPHAGSHTSPISRPRRTSSACASRRSTRCSAPAPRPKGPRAMRPVVVISAVALSEKVPDPELRPHSFTLRVGELIDLDECASALVDAGYERVEQVEERGQFALRGGILDIFGATEERAVRVDTFDVEIESLRWFSTFTQRSLGEVAEVELAPAAELAVEHRELAEIAAATGAFPGGQAGSPSASTSPSCCRSSASAPCSICWASEPRWCIAAEEELEPALGDHWSDVCAAFGDEDAGHLYVPPERIREALSRAHPDLAVGAVLRAGDRAAGPGRRLCRPLAGGGRAGARAPGALRLQHRGHVPPPRRGRARRLQPRPPESGLGRGPAGVERLGRCGRPRGSSASRRRRCGRASSRPA